MTMPTLVICKPKLPTQYGAQRDILSASLTGFEGVDVFYLPVFELKAVVPALEQLKQILALTPKKSAKMIVFVSPSAAEIALGFIAVDWPEAVYCGVMGRQSAQLVERLGVPAHRLVYPCSPNNSETEDSHGLANLIGQMFPQGDCEVIVCKGPKGRSDFGKRLIHENYSFSQLECYDRLVINQTELECKQLLALGENAVMWLTSSETIGVLDEQLLSSFPDEVPAFRSLCVLLTTHPRITTKCLELGYARVFQISTGIQSVKEWLDIQKKT